MHKDSANVEHELYDYTGNNMSHWNSNGSFKGKVGSHSRKTTSGFSKKKTLY